MSRAILTERFVSYSSKRQTEYSRQDQHLIELHGTNVDERERKKIERERERNDCECERIGNKMAFVRGNVKTMMSILVS